MYKLPTLLLTGAMTLSLFAYQVSTVGATEAMNNEMMPSHSPEMHTMSASPMPSVMPTHTSEMHTMTESPMPSQSPDMMSASQATETHMPMMNIHTDSSTADHAMSYKQTFMTHLTGDQEVPPVITETTGMATLHLSEDERSVHYSLTINKAQNITAAHLHCAPVGVNGPVVAPLFSSDDGITAEEYTTSGMLDASDITEAAMNCNPNIRTISHLAQAMREGMIYLNVHSVEHPNGVIRGQVMQK